MGTAYLDLLGSNTIIGLLSISYVDRDRDKYGIAARLNIKKLIACPFSDRDRGVLTATAVTF